MAKSLDTYKAKGSVAPSKAELTAYWKNVGKEAFRHLAKRPLDLVPNEPSEDVSKAIHWIQVDDGYRYWIDSLEGLLGLIEWKRTVEVAERLRAPAG